MIRTIQQSTKEVLTKENEGDLYQAKQSIEPNNYEYPTLTLKLNFQKPEVEANIYVRCVLRPKVKFLPHPWTSFSNNEC